MSVFVVCVCGVHAGCVRFFRMVGCVSLVLCCYVGFLVLYLVYSSIHVPDCCMGLNQKHIRFPCIKNAELNTVNRLYTVN